MADADVDRHRQLQGDEAEGGRGAGARHEVEDGDMQGAGVARFDPVEEGDPHRRVADRGGVGAGVLAGCLVDRDEVRTRAVRGRVAVADHPGRLGDLQGAQFSVGEFHPFFAGDLAVDGELGGEGVGVRARPGRLGAVGFGEFDPQVFEPEVGARRSGPEQRDEQGAAGGEVQREALHRPVLPLAFPFFFCSLTSCGASFCGASSSFASAWSSSPSGCRAR